MCMATMLSYRWESSWSIFISLEFQHHMIVEGQLRKVVPKNEVYLFFEYLGTKGPVLGHLVTKISCRKLCFYCHLIVMKSITTALLIVLSIGAIQCVNWSNITVTELNNLPPSAFTTITADQLASIPSDVSSKQKQPFTGSDISACSIKRFCSRNC